jgi:hypothetical protein
MIVSRRQSLSAVARLSSCPFSNLFGERLRATIAEDDWILSTRYPFSSPVLVHRSPIVVASDLQQKSDCQSGTVCLTKVIMTTVEEIEHAVAELAPSELSRLTAWMREYDAKVWDGQMEDDSASGRLDFLFEEAESEPDQNSVTP